jgi:predicted RNA-binding Zn ribbon-like protein
VEGFHTFGQPYRRGFGLPVLTVVRVTVVRAIQGRKRQVDERDKRRVGEAVEPGGRAKAPGRLELLQRFVNTHNHDLPPAWDRIGTGAKATRWLRRKGLLAPGMRVGDADAQRLRELREAIRALALANHGEPPDASATEGVRRAAREAALRVAVDATGRTALEPSSGGVDGAVATLLAILHDAQVAGDWARLKGCRRCGYAFYDRSRNRSAAWCAMAICGNRAKNRAYYRRRTASA